MRRLRGLEADDFRGLLEFCLERRLVFAAWRLPGTTEPRLLAQARAAEAAGDLDELLADGAFLIAPFSGGAETLALRPEVLVRGRPSGPELAALAALGARARDREPLRGAASPHPAVPEAESAQPAAAPREAYLEAAERVLAEIRAGAVDKVVLSRIKEVEGSYRERLPEIFEALSAAHPSAFVYLFDDGRECWIGASPETLLRAEGEELLTMSLAGTRPYAEANLEPSVWNDKERGEQDYVTRQIAGVLADFGVDSPARRGPYARRAGSLLHLCSEFSFPRRALEGRLGPFLAALHPTPAVCGIPRRKAAELIAAVEGRGRGYYAGYLGPLGPAAEGSVPRPGAPALELFVNLRCMRVLPGRLELHVGGGLTAGSRPEEEWEETELKAETLLAAIRELP